MAGQSQASDAGHRGAEKQLYASTVSASPFCHYSASEHSVKTFHHHSTASKSPFSSLCAILRQAERLFESRYVQYAACSKDFPVRFRKANLIFPFHYFW